MTVLLIKFSKYKKLLLNHEHFILIQKYFVLGFLYINLRICYPIINLIINNYLIMKKQFNISLNSKNK